MQSARTKEVGSLPIQEKLWANWNKLVDEAGFMDLSRV
jgi:hypothetical protein